MWSMKPFKFWSQKILPLVYEDSLSYYEVLCKTTKKLNELIEQINELPDLIKSLLVDENVEQILSELLNQLREQIASANEGTSETATANREKGDLVWLNGYLYRITRDMGSGDRYVVGSNCEKITIENLLLNEYLIDEETIVLNGVANGTTIVERGDYHVYNGSNSAIEIFEA